MSAVSSQFMPNSIMVTNTPGYAAKDLHTFANAAAAGTDTSIIAAVTGKVIRVTGLILVAGGTATDITFNSKGSGAGTAISALFALPIRGIVTLSWNPQGWFDTASGEGLTVTTGAGATTGIQVVYTTF